MVVRALETKSRAAGSLDAFGRATMSEGKVILDLGEGAVYAVALHCGHRDWKVRYWIADMLGYLDNSDAGRPLLRMLEKEGEHPLVKQQALRSMKRLRLPLPKKFAALEQKAANLK